MYPCDALIRGAMTAQQLSIILESMGIGRR
jgi:hypothetical protein